MERDADDLEAIAPAGAGERMPPVPRRASPAAHTESLGEALGRTIGDLGFEPADQVTPAALEIGIALRRERLARGLTQADLARQIGISQAMLSAIENGKGRDGPTYATIRSIGEALGLELALRPSVSSEVTASPSLQQVPSASAGAASVEAQGVRSTGLGEEGANFVRDMVSSGAVAALRVFLSKSGLLRMAAHQAVEAQLWKVDPHAKAVINAGWPLVLLALDSAMKIRLLQPDAKRTSFYQVDDLTCVGPHSKVELANLGETSSMVFAVSAAEFIRLGESAGD